MKSQKTPYNALLLLKQTLVCSSNEQQSQSTDIGLGWRKVQRLHLLQGTHYGVKHGDQATYAKKNLKFPTGFPVGVFKVRVRERLTECVVNLGTILWLVDGEVTGWWFENLNHQHSGSNQSGIYVFVASVQLPFST